APPSPPPFPYTTLFRSDPFRTGDTLLVIRPRSALAQPKESAAATKPTNIDSFCLAIDAPDEPRVGRIIFGMNRRCRPKRHKIATVLVWLGPPVLEIDVHFDHVVVFVLRGFFEEELFPHGDLFACRPLKLHNRI